jgi:hypothetical protein
MGIKLANLLFGAQRLSDWHRVNQAAQVRSGMQAEFKDDKGRWYYSFRDEGDVPITRLSEAHTHLQYMAAGLSAETWKQALDTITICLAKQDIIKAGVVINDLTDLEKKIVNLDALVNIIAINYVREDEDVSKVSASIHAEKCDFLKHETEEGRFFFRLPMFVRLLSGLTVSKQDATTLSRNFLQVSENLKRRWSILRSEQPTTE